jgi:hypothetical protein
VSNTFPPKKNKEILSLRDKSFEPAEIIKLNFFGLDTDFKKIKFFLEDINLAALWDAKEISDLLTDSYSFSALERRWIVEQCGNYSYLREKLTEEQLLGMKRKVGLALAADQTDLQDIDLFETSANSAAAAADPSPAKNDNKQKISVGGNNLTFTPVNQSSDSPRSKPKSKVKREIDCSALPTATAKPK